MALYLGIATVLFCLAFMRLIGAIDSRYEKHLVFCLTVLAFMAATIRWETGTDWDSYISTFESLTSFDAARAQSWWGPGYAYTAVLVNSWHGGYTVFLLCIAAILFGMKYHVLTKTCAAPLVAVFVLFCTNFYDIFFTRESVANVFFLGFAYYYYRRLWAAAALCGTIAVLFHYSAALPIGIVVMFGRFAWGKALLLVVGAAAAIYLFFQFANVDNFAPARAVAQYVSSDYVEEKTSALSTTARAYAKLAFWAGVVFASYIAFDKRLGPVGTDKEGEWTFFILRCATGILATAALLLPLSEVFARVPSYAEPLFAVVLANYRLGSRRLSAAGTAYLAILTLLFIELGFLFSGYAQYYYPFRTILGR